MIRHAEYVLWQDVLDEIDDDAPDPEMFFSFLERNCACDHPDMSNLMIGVDFDQAWSDMMDDTDAGPTAEFTKKVIDVLEKWSSGLSYECNVLFENHHIPERRYL